MFGHSANDIVKCRAKHSKLPQLASIPIRYVDDLFEWQRQRLARGLSYGHQVGLPIQTCERQNPARIAYLQENPMEFVTQRMPGEEIASPAVDK